MCRGWWRIRFKSWHKWQESNECCSGRLNKMVTRWAILDKGCKIGDARGWIVLSMIYEEKVWLGGFEAKGNVNSSYT